MGSYIASVGAASAWDKWDLYTLNVNTDSGKIRMISGADVICAGYQVFSPDKTILYTTIETYKYEGHARGGAAAYRVDKDGNLSFINEVPTVGQLPCHISISPDGGTVYLASYLTGCLSIHSVREDGGIGTSRQVLQYPAADGILPSVHFSATTPDGRYLCVINITAHRISFYELSERKETAEEKLNEVWHFQMDPDEQRRPRQIVFVGSHAYVLTEMGKEVLVFDYQPDSEELLKYREVHLLFPENEPVPGGRVSAAALKVSPDHKLLAASVRAYDLITLFAIGEDGSLGGRVFNRIKGETPRDFAFSPDGRCLLVGAQKSEQMELYKIGADRNLKLLGDPFHLAKPLCVNFR